MPSRSPYRSKEQGRQQAVGEVRKQASNVADAAGTAARRTADSFETALREVIETQPYTAVGVALAIGWILGRMHRPL
jgi:ElaB/YqjD/DUF883 family membrane-anchored ribosome-binding protein